MPLEVLTSFIELIEEHPNSVYLSCVGDTLYAHNLAERPSLNDATKACEDIKLSTLEKHYTEMKNKINERLKTLQAKLKKGQPITSEEEEWMDGDGNLVDAELLMEKISFNASYAEKVEVLDWHHQKGKNQSKTAAHFDKIYPHLKIKQPLISKWFKDEAAIRSKNIESNNLSTKRLQAVSYPQVKEALNKWMKQAMHLNLTVTEAATGDPKTQAKDLFNVNQLTAMKMAKKAWESVSQQTVSNCWGATKICTQIAYGGCSERIQTTIDQDEAFLLSQLDTLETIGAVLRVNRMLIQSLLNPEGENDLATTVYTEEEISNMVKAQENEDQVDDDDEPERPIVQPTKKQMVNHISQTLMYLDGKDDPESNALSNLLEKYQQKLVNNVHFNGQQTTLTNFFKPVGQA
ncbi:hypothetical protein H4Q26_003705 [Puccinia striiformis f. sp. tritici PST-130]|nr:hypothetical protein H4Q26_003705 [Puccinia striiformis f. sp. tritici PST-130]